jgi:hypothetical protein
MTSQAASNAQQAQSALAASPPERQACQFDSPAGSG